MDLTTATPVEIDTALAEIYTRLYVEWDVEARLSKWIEEYEQGLAKKESGEHEFHYLSYTQDGLTDLETRLDESVERGLEIHAETEPYQAEYKSRPWTRFYLVQNNGGHIHSSMHCSTCYPTTRFGWLPELSGQTEAEAVKAHGAILCTVCYPSAPTEWTDRHDDSVCPGSGQVFDGDQPFRRGYYSGNYGHCRECGSRQTISKIGNIRKHKKA